MCVLLQDLDNQQSSLSRWQTLPGWHTDIREVRKFSDLPAEAQAYVERVEELVGVRVGWVANGPEREALMERDS